MVYRLCFLYPKFICLLKLFIYIGFNLVCYRMFSKTHQISYLAT